MCKCHRERSLHGLIEVVTGGQRRTLRLCRRLLCMLALPAAALSPVTASAQPAPTVEITPNAIQELDEPMGIAITGSGGATLHVLVLQSCDSNPATPELSSRGSCKSPLWQRAVTLDHKGQWHDSMRLTELPRDEQLWLRVSTDPDGAGPCGQIIFTIRSSGSCSLVDTFFSLFTGGACTAGSPRIIILARPYGRAGGRRIRPEPDGAAQRGGSRPARPQESRIKPESESEGAPSELEFDDSDF
jgi:hypothetical protein